MQHTHKQLVTTKAPIARAHQTASLHAMRKGIRSNHLRQILCLPTGGGKTFTFTMLAHSALGRGKRVLIVTDRTELMKQAGGSLYAFGMTAEEIKPDNEPDFVNGRLFTAMVETLKRRLAKRDARYVKLMQAFDVAIFDEAHKQAFNKLFPFLRDDSVVIGATATPYRDKGMQSLREDYSLIVEEADIPGLIDAGYLAQPRTFRVDVDLSQVATKGRDYDTESMGQQYSKQQVWAGVIKEYERLTPGKKALVFCANIASSREMCEKFIEAGYDARALDNNVRKADRPRILAWYDKTPGAILCNVDILTTGFDSPSTEVIILYRATKSLPLFLQMCGRGSRVIPGVKDTFYILDFGMNTLPNAHGLWETPRKWSLDPPVRKNSNKVQAHPVKTCKGAGCGAMLAVSVRTCPYCGYQYTKTAEEELQERIATLVEVPKRDRLAIAEGLVGGEGWVQELAAMCKAGAVHPFWVLRKLITRYDDAEAFRKSMGYKPGFWYHNKSRFAHLFR